MTAPQSKIVWKYDQCNTDKLNEEIRSTNWDRIINSENTDSAVRHFNETFLKIVQKCVPCKRVIFKPRDRPWINENVRRAIKLRNRYLLIINEPLY